MTITIEKLDEGYAVLIRDADESTNVVDALAEELLAERAKTAALTADLAAVTAQRDHFETQHRAARSEILSLKSQVQSQRRNRR